ncbi:Putative major facilitator superfamily, MFS transporter superfamily [Septoria linicola]|uniref:Major facilitator superfamily, MFS transporter superfamily n=1 Tax=Septoria linicola TaxID=215465 RepID=A0A9Q9ART3_9PEZI|nr:putative major facilitator superfamily, MFS transporter superfamily [Septoria linicola]USW50856.1 Putative major facilitator superfamily, MFS transporter superfamily [Septoria linicola]
MTFKRQDSSVPLLAEERRDDTRRSGSREEGRGLMGERTLSQDIRDGHGVEMPGYDTEGNALTAMEKKYRLVDAEIDSHGMGRYQWFVWLLCGFGYLLDLLWAQAFGLVLGPLQQELGFGDGESGNISVAFSAGLTVGAFFWGIMGDVIGRRWVFNLTCFISGAFGIALGGVSTYGQFLVLVVFIGFGIGGNIPVDTTICLEFLPSDRQFLLAMLSIFQPIGVVGTCAIAYAFVPSHSCSPNFSEADALPSCYNVAEGEACCTSAQNMGWRYVVYTLGAVNVMVFLLRFVIFTIQESPKFLLSHGRDAEAIKVLEAVAKSNNRVCNLKLSDFERADTEDDSESAFSGRVEYADKKYWKSQAKKELGRYKQLFQGKQMIVVTVLVWLTYIFDFWGFTLAGYYFPKIIAIKNSEVDVSLRRTYRNYIAIYAPGILGVVLGAMLVRVSRLGQKWTMVLSSGLMGLSIIIFSTVNSEASNIGLNIMEYFFQSMFNAVLYGWTPGVFPADIRGTATGLATTWGRLFSILAPLIAQSIQSEDGLKDPETLKTFLYMAGGITLGCVVTTALLPNKIKRR